MPPAGCTCPLCAIHLWCSQFGGYGHKRKKDEDGLREHKSARVFTYERRPDIEALRDHGFVRILYKINIQDVASEHKPEFLPHAMNSTGEWHAGGAARVAPLSIFTSV